MGGGYELSNPKGNVPRRQLPNEKWPFRGCVCARVLVFMCRCLCVLGWRSRRRPAGFLRFLTKTHKSAQQLRVQVVIDADHSCCWTCAREQCDGHLTSCQLSTLLKQYQLVLLFLIFFLLTASSLVRWWAGAGATAPFTGPSVNLGGGRGVSTLLKCISVLKVAPLLLPLHLPNFVCNWDLNWQPSASQARLSYQHLQ